MCSVDARLHAHETTLSTGERTAGEKDERHVFGERTPVPRPRGQRGVCAL